MSFPRYPNYKDSGVAWLGEVPEHWGVGSVRWLTRRFSGGTPDKTNLEYWEDGTVPWLNSVYGVVKPSFLSQCWCNKSSDPPEDGPEQVTWDRDLGHLERGVPSVGHDLRSDLDQPHQQRRHRPVLHRARQGQTAKEVAEVVGEGEELETDLIVVEVVARELRPLHRVLSLLDPLLRNAPAVVKLDHALL